MGIRVGEGIVDQALAEASLAHPLTAYYVDFDEHVSLGGLGLLYFRFFLSAHLTHLGL